MHQSAHRHNGEGAVHHACTYGGVHRTLDPRLHEDAGGVVEDLARGSEMVNTLIDPVQKNSWSSCRWDSPR